MHVLRKADDYFIETTVRTRRLLGSGALLRVGDHRLPKRVMSGELENAGKRGAERKEKQMKDGLCGMRSSGVWHHGGLEHRRTRPWGLVQHSMRRGL